MTSLGTVSRVRTQSMIIFHINMLNFSSFPKDQSTELLTVTMCQQHSERMLDTQIHSCSSVPSNGAFYSIIWLYENCDRNSKACLLC